jgi:hypothetical protein
MSACENNFTETVTYQINEPVFMNADEFRAKVKVTNEAREIKKQGKITFYEGYSFISEPDEGIHIIDNRNPSAPLNVGFIELTGNADMAIRDNLLYADSYIDLVCSTLQIRNRLSLPDVLTRFFRMHYLLSITPMASITICAMAKNASRA